MQDPSPYLQRLEVTVESALDERVPARIEDESLSRVNYEIYYTAQPEEKSRFEHDPVRYCGFVTDPVTKQRFRPHAKSPRADFAGRPWFFVNHHAHSSRPCPTASCLLASR